MVINNILTEYIGVAKRIEEFKAMVQNKAHQPKEEIQVSNGGNC